MKECGNKECNGHDEEYEDNCNATEEGQEVENCCDFKPLITQTEPVAEVPCSDGVIKHVVCSEAREDCDGCSHAEKHRPIGHDKNGLCTKTLMCAVNEIDVYCKEVL